MNSIDLSNTHSPDLLEQRRGPYIESNLHKLNIDLSGEIWNLRYNNTHNILSGVIDNDYTRLIGVPNPNNNGMIEFPVSQEDPNNFKGVRVVDNLGVGIQEFTLNLPK